MDELIKKELLSLVDEIRDYVNDLEYSPKNIFVFDGICCENYCFDIRVNVEWETGIYTEYGDVCECDYTGNIENWEVDSVTAYDDDDTEIEVSQEIINLFNEKI